MESALTNATGQTNFTNLDWGIVAVYLLLSVAVAFWVKRFAGNMTNFVGAGRAVGTWLGIATLTGTEMGLITVMYSAQKGFTSGFAAFHIGVIGGIVAFLVGMTGLIVVRLRKHEVLTIPEYYGKRYGPRTRILGGIMLAFGGLLNMGLFLKVGAMFIVGITGMNPDGSALKLVMVGLLVLVLIYTVIGGMISVVITDYIQFVVLSIGILVTGYLAVESVGGFATLFDEADKLKGREWFDPTDPKSGFGTEYLAWMFFLGIVNCALWPTAVARALAMESTTALKRQYKWSSISFAIRMIIPNLLGICAFIFIMNKAPDLQALFFPEESDANQVNNLYAMPIYLGRILPAGLIGLITAAMIAAFMSTHDGYLLCWSSVITQDIIAPLFKERLNNPTRIKITRILIILIGLYILYWGLFYGGEEDIWDYMAITGAIYFTGAFSLLFGGLYWKRASSTGAVLALVAGCTAILGLGPVQQAIHSYIPGSLDGKAITLVEDTTIKFEEFKEKDSPEKSFIHYMFTDFIMAPFEQAKPWRRNALEEWTAMIRQPSGILQAVEVTYSRNDEIEVENWPKFEPKNGDIVSFYKPISGARVGLMTIAFTMLVFFVGSILFPDRKLQVIIQDDSKSNKTTSLDSTGTKISNNKNESQMP